MAKSLIEQSDLEKGYTIIESVHYVIGVSAGPSVVIRGGTHPKMRILTSLEDTALASSAGNGPVGATSFAVAMIAGGAGAHLTVEHSNQMDAAVALGADALHSIYPFKKATTAATVTTDTDVFEADEDVVLEIATASNAATDAVLVVLKFEVVN